MKRINNSNFERIEDVIKSLDLKYNQEEFLTIEKLDNYWIEIVGKKISEFSKVFDISSDNQITITCADSFIANELYFEKEKILKRMKEKAQETGIIIQDIKFDYKKWKERNNE